MEDKILYNVLKEASKNGNPGDKAPDYDYVKSLENIGLIKLDYDRTYLTELGASILKMLEGKFEKW